MTDKEMLELAARAYGFGADSGGFIWTCSEYPRDTNKSGALWNYKGWRETAELWNPLTDDGDAFRLMVALRLWRDDPDICCIERVEDHDGDAYAATRRAIVRAAAQIGAQL